MAVAAEGKKFVKQIALKTTTERATQNGEGLLDLARKRCAKLSAKSSACIIGNNEPCGS